MKVASLPSEEVFQTLSISLGTVPSDSRMRHDRGHQPNDMSTISGAIPIFVDAHTVNEYHSRRTDLFLPPELSMRDLRNNIGTQLTYLRAFEMKTPRRRRQLQNSQGRLDGQGAALK